MQCIYAGCVISQPSCQSSKVEQGWNRVGSSGSHFVRVNRVWPALWDIRVWPGFYIVSRAFPILLEMFWIWPLMVTIFKDTKGSRAWQQFRIVLVLQHPSVSGATRPKSCLIVWILNEDLKCSELRVAVCVKQTLQKKVSCFQQLSLYSTGSYPGLTRIAIQVSGSSGSVVLTRFQPWGRSNTRITTIATHDISHLTSCSNLDFASPSDSQSTMIVSRNLTLN